MIEMLKGKKTYIVALLVAIVTAALQLEYIDMEIASTLYGLLGATGLATLRSGVDKS